MCDGLGGSGSGCVFRELRRVVGSGVGFARLFVFLEREHVAKFEEAVEVFDGAAMCSD